MRLILALLVVLAGPASAETLTILHTNDVHSRLEPVNRFNITCTAAERGQGTCQGGAARLKTAIDAARAKAKHVMLLDGGDQFQGSHMYMHYKGRAAAEIMTVLGYDAMVVGNHEFDDGPGALRVFLDNVDFPVLMANVDASREPLLAGVALPSTILQRGAHRYGLIGVTTDEIPETSSPGGQLRFEDPVAALRREITRLEAEGINRIIVLSHLGYASDKDIATMVPGIDVIVGGQTHALLSNQIDGADGPYPTWVDTPTGRTAIVQAYAYGRFLGRLELSFDPSGRLIEATGGPIPLTSNIDEDPALGARIDALAGPLEMIRNEFIAETATMIGSDLAACRSQACSLGNMVADAMLARVKSLGIDIAIINSGALRVPLPAGQVSRGDVQQMLPFANTLSMFSLTGNDLRAALEHGVSAVEVNHGRFPQVAGLRFDYNPAAATDRPRISGLKVYRNGNWEPVLGNTTYEVVTNEFLRRGGDGYRLFKDKAIRPYDFGPDLVDVITEYLQQNQPYAAISEPRIVPK